MKVFISHSHTDEALARRVADGLEAAGLEVWDERQILPGENWAAKVAEALQSCEAMVVLLTPNSLRSTQVRREIDYALSTKDYSHRLIPVLAGPQDQISREEIPWIFHHLNLINLAKYDRTEEGIQQIAQTLTRADATSDSNHS
jgi:hypothetical protein